MQNLLTTASVRFQNDSPAAMRPLKLGRSQGGSLTRHTDGQTAQKVAPWVLMLVFAAASIAGLLARPAIAAEPAPAAPPQATVQPTPPSPPAGAVVDPQYVIGPGDTVQVFVWRNPELSVTVPVRPDGKISTPLVEDMIAVGRTSTELAREIEKKLAEYIRSPQVNIIVTNPVSTFSQVRVIGEVTNPQSVPYREGLTALDVVLAVGGLTEFAAGNRAKIVRKGADGKTVEIKVRLEALVRKGKMSENVDVRPGDVMIVPESFF
jgi:polysaccharide export outer membrane protein